jgi:hypothetical protein
VIVFLLGISIVVSIIASHREKRALRVPEPPVPHDISKP